MDPGQKPTNPPAKGTLNPSIPEGKTTAISVTVGKNESGAFVKGVLNSNLSSDAKLNVGVSGSTGSGFGFEVGVSATF